MPGPAIGRTKEKSSVERKPATREDSNLQTRIAQRAYELYVQRGYEPGGAEEDWFRAEREILGERIITDTE